MNRMRPRTGLEEPKGAFGVRGGWDAAPEARGGMEGECAALLVNERVGVEMEPIPLDAANVGVIAATVEWKRQSVVARGKQRRRVRARVRAPASALQLAQPLQFSSTTGRQTLVTIL
jgi:hypothetical protein